MHTQHLNDKDFEIIESYLMNRLDDQQKREFEKRMADDDQLKAEVEKVKDLIIGVEASALKELMDTFHVEAAHQASSTASTTPKIRPLKPWTTYLVAASFLLLFAIGTLWFWESKPAYEKVFARHFTSDPGLITPMSTQQNYDFYQGMVVYRLGDYAGAIDIWESMLPQIAANDTLTYFLGVAYLAKSQAVNAIDFLSAATEFENSVFLNDAWFYLGMAFLKQGEIALARQALNNSNMETAAEVLNDLYELSL